MKSMSKQTKRTEKNTHRLNQNENNSGAKGKTNEKHSLCKYSTLTHCNECLWSNESNCSLANNGAHKMKNQQNDHKDKNKIHK